MRVFPAGHSRPGDARRERGARLSKIHHRRRTPRRACASSHRPVRRRLPSHHASLGPSLLHTVGPPPTPPRQAIPQDAAAEAEEFHQCNSRLEVLRADPNTADTDPVRAGRAAEGGGADHDRSMAHRSSAQSGGGGAPGEAEKTRLRLHRSGSVTISSAGGTAVRLPHDVVAAGRGGDSADIDAD